MRTPVRLELSPALLLLFGLAASSCSAQAATAVHPITGLVDGTEIDIATKVPGRIEELLVHEGDRVKRNQELVVIRSDEIEARMAQVNASVAAAEARLRMARAGARVEDRDAAARQLDSARHQLELAQKTYDRVKQLLSSGSVPQAAFDEADAKLNLARDQVSVAQTRHDLAVKGSRPEEIQALAALVEQGRGSLAEVKSYDREARQKSPVDGEVVKIVLHRGELAGTGAPILTVLDRSDIWASFPVREDLLRGLQTGAVVEAEVPALGRRMRFRVFSISAMGDFATWRATNERSGFDLKSFEVKARPEDGAETLRPGMTVRWQPGR